MTVWCRLETRAKKEQRSDEGRDAEQILSSVGFCAFWVVGTSSYRLLGTVYCQLYFCLFSKMLRCSYSVKNVAVKSKNMIFKKNHNYFSLKSSFSLSLLCWHNCTFVLFDQIYPSDHNSNNFSSAPSTPGSPQAIAGNVLTFHSGDQR